MIFRADKLLTKLPVPKHPSKEAAAAVKNSSAARRARCPP